MAGQPAPVYPSPTGKRPLTSIVGDGCAGTEVVDDAVVVEEADEVEDEDEDEVEDGDLVADEAEDETVEERL